MDAIATHFVQSDNANLREFRRSDLRTLNNQKGEGTIVYLDWSDSYVWLVVDGQGYALNGRAEAATPSLPWPREAPAAVWAKTGLDVAPAMEIMELVKQSR